MGGDFGRLWTTDGRELKVDADTAEEYRSRKLYMKNAQARDVKTDTPLAKLVLGLPKGPEYEVRFANGDRLDCRRDNLSFIRRGDVASTFDDLFE